MNYLIKGVFLILLWTPIAFANDTFEKVGEGKMEYLLWDVYDAVLYSPDGSYSLGSNPVKFKLTYLRDIKAKDIVNATNKQWQHLGKGDLAKKYDDKLMSIWPDIKKGDSLTLLTDNDGKSIFLHNDKEIGAIEDSDFAAEFLAIWLSKNTSEPELRKHLLGK